MDQANPAAALRNTVDYSGSKPALSDRILLLTFYAAASVYLTLPPLLSARPAAWAVSLLVFLFGTAVQVRLVGSFAAVPGYLLPVLGAGLLSGSLQFSAWLGALITAACCLAWLCLTMPSPLLGIPPLLAYLAAAGLLHDPLLATAALLPLPCALAMAFVLRRQVARVGAVCRIAVTLAATVLALALLLWNDRMGAFSPALLREGVETARQSAIAALTEFLHTAGLPQGVNGSSDTVASEAVNLFFNYLPALTILFFTVMGWILHTAILRVARGRSLPRRAIRRMLSFDMSLTSAVLFGVSFLLSFLPCTGRAAVIPVLFANLYLCLIPGMLMTARLALDALLWRRVPALLGFLLYLTLFFLLLTAPSVALPLFACFGAGVTAVGQIRRRRKKNDMKG